MTLTTGVELTFEEFVAKAVAEAQPMGQNVAPGDLGFGSIYYALARNLRPEFIVAIGSCRGFMPFCAARALRDNGSGHLLFIDPSYAGPGDPGWDGEGAWHDPAEVEARIASFGLSGFVTHLKATSADAFPRVRELVGDSSVGLVIVDGAHTRANSLEDFELYSSLVDEGFVVFHDSTNPVCEVSQTIDALRAQRFPMITIHRDAGLTIVEVERSPRVDTHWSYLGAGNRADRLLPHARAILRPGDRVLDAYCGYSPLAALLDDVEVFGYDRDGAIVQRLREQLPQHRWARIDESWLPFAKELPETVDVVFGLGLSRGRAPWDPEHVADNVRYLLGRYYPRACLFETAADYFDGEILDDLAPILARLGYACRTGIVETDLASFSRRKLLVSERSA